MASHMFTCTMRRKRKLPYIVALWSGYYMAALSVCAFAILDQWIDSAIEIFSALMISSTTSLLLGMSIGRLLGQRAPVMGRLVALLGLAAIFTLFPLLLGDAFSAAVLQSQWSDAGAAIIACALFAPSLTLLAAIPPYASSLLIRDRGRAGSVNGAVMICTTFGFGIGSLATAHHLISTLATADMMKTISALSGIIIALALIFNPPARISGR